VLHLHDALLVSAAADTAPRRPALVPGCRLVPDGDRYLVENGGTVVTLEGHAAHTLLPRLLPLLDGTRTIDELASELGPAIVPAIDQALTLLDSNRLLTEGTTSGLPDDVTAAARFAAAVTRRASEESAARAVVSARVAVLGSGVAAVEAERQLSLLGLGCVDVGAIDGEPASGAFVLAAPAPDELSELTAVNDRALARGFPWLQLLPFDGRVLIVGPLFLPGSSACHRCFRLRRGACSGYEDDFDLVERTPLRISSPGPLTAIGVGLASLVALRWVTTSDPTLPGSLCAVELHSVVRLTHSRLLRVPRCPACGPRPQAVPSPWFEASP
jgi:bacteriocin biosynthesis cyclodehydratase domain-containing protein